MPKIEENLPIEIAVRIRDAWVRSGMDEPEFCEMAGHKPGWLYRVCGPKALKSKDAKRTVPSAMTMRRIATGCCISLDYLNGLTEDPGPAANGFIGEALPIIENMTTQLAQLARAQCAANGFAVGLDAFINWHERTGGVIGLNHPMEQFVDVIGLPTADSDAVVPIKIGKQSLSRKVFNTTNPKKLGYFVDRMPEHEKRHLTKVYSPRVLEQQNYTVSHMTAAHPDHAEPWRWNALRTTGKLLHENSRMIGLCLAFPSALGNLPYDG